MRATTIAASGLLAGLALLASSCGSGSSGATPAAATTTTPTTATSRPSAAGRDSASFTKFAACMKAHGATVGQFRVRSAQAPPAGQPPGAQRPFFGRRNLTPAQQKKFQNAVAACRKLAPQGPGGGVRGFGGRFGGQNNPQFAKYRACMKKHGVTLPQPGSAQPGASATPASSKAFRTATRACGALLAAAVSGNR